VYGDVPAEQLYARIGRPSHGRRPARDGTRPHLCALRGGGSRVSCWGGNSDGQLGKGTTTDSLVPVDVIDLKQGVNSIAAGSVFTCARAPTGAAFCWGEDLVNELGDGAVTNQSQPVSVAGFSWM
jgi:alpha-tubulin suppressor-like RCC1 family protein